ncbi:MAG: 3-phosphoshikimate 1-carboxyvinyltransferase [Deltaproteobacteria bacterium]|nr:3-phosphoshikimate 1-carboxyvinyltransferase [Deltaproteobacteria bacterium]
MTGARSWRVRRSGGLRGTVRVPGDKSIAHRALLFAALADGECTLDEFPGGLDNVATADALRAMGVAIAARDGTVLVGGRGLRGLRMAATPIDCGNSGTTMRLLAGLLAAQQFGTRLVGDASLSRRPMRRVIEPLRARGAHIAGSALPGKEGELYPPLSIAPLIDGERLHALDLSTGVASAQVKSAMLLSGLYADGPTLVTEPTVSRDHTERMLDALGVPIERVGPAVALDPRGWRGAWDPFRWSVPGDLSAAAFPLVAALVVPDSDVTLPGVGTNPTRTGLLEALGDMRGRVATGARGTTPYGEPIGDLRAATSALRGALVAGERIVRAIDEVPALCVAAACAEGRTEIANASELRVKESDRIAAMASVLASFGASVEERPDGLVIEGARGRLRGARIDSRGDHRIAMSACVLGLVAEGDTEVDDVACVDTSFPGFAALLRSLGAEVEEHGP